MIKDPSDPGVDLHVTQLYGEGTIRTTWPWIHSYGHSLLTEQLDPIAEKGLKGAAPTGPHRNNYRMT
jgi:hypothetical protein